MDQTDPQNEKMPATLRELVTTREICFDVLREQVAFQHAEATAVGYELVLSGIHSQGDHPPLPGCDLCRDVYEDLKKVAESILPREHRRSFYEIEPYQPIIRATPKRGLRNEVTLSIKILHRDHYRDPIDQCETRCLLEMENRLKAFGACQGAWKSAT